MTMMIDDVQTVEGVGLCTIRHVEALGSTNKHFPKDRKQKAELSTGLTVEYVIESSIDADQPECDEFPEERLLLISAYVMPKEGWAPLIDMLLGKWDTKKQGKKLKILSFDNRGSGGSDKPWTRYTTSQMAEDALHLMDYVGWDSAHVAGTSMGGMISIELAAIAPDRVGSLTLIVTTRGHYLPHPKAWKSFLGTVLGGSMKSVIQLLYPSDIFDGPIEGCDNVKVLDVLEEFHSVPPTENGFPPLHALVAQGVACLTHFVSDERLEAVGKSGFPVLIVGGMQDILIPPENSVTLLDRLKGDQVETLFFETAGHGVFFQFVEEVADVAIIPVLGAIDLLVEGCDVDEKTSQFAIRLPTTKPPMVYYPVVSPVGISTQRQVDALYASSKYFAKEQCHRVAISTGITVEYVVHTIENDPQQPPEHLVLIPGFMQPKDTWAQLIDTLVPKWTESQGHGSLSIVAMDNRGFGGSDAPFWRYTTRQLAEDTLALMDQLGWGVAHVVGISMGGMISLELSTLAPQRVLSLTLISTTRGNYKMDSRSRVPMLRNIFSLTAAGKAKSVVEMLFPAEFLQNRITETGESVRDVLIRMFTKQWPRLGLSGLIGQAAAAQTHFVSDERLREINDMGFPVLIVSGMQDFVIPAAESIILKECMIGDHVRTLFFDNGGHGAACQFADEVVHELVETMHRGYQRP
ncbi:hypothetical protein BBO99_00009137 [Phytophthora kernoviae]|uniref:AB hydrolase-1 domain-containing protein n=2 Tax=Phytophthora kernoviae TaxID=325452 RepID=A0A3R7JNZ2_9STRA|nr:hypothetical protein G195_010698 [Phytophthora kernoviae 00238/432]KAG2507330.1 hypothetical protein JM16_009008 [Phytophthora kernoviae]KAG2509894.1 hypothetical protein JM18_009037 [Phytophthora kernoviae]RLN10817.1 hypothetical protein BBI17_009154 [Phytophthora kernoviae]RLN73992.1 hypothetical protein BBO99_00009137 [Phytophthora kernoviae]